MDPHCHYPRLPSAHNAIRLIFLEPGQAEDDIVCELRVVKLLDNSSDGSAQSYTAVSYAWGDGSSNRKIRVGAWPVLIRENLWQLLKHTRHDVEPVILWVDYLCIDQSDKKERAIQVQVMDMIYKGAKQVLVWLGNAMPKDLMAMDLIQRVGASTLESFSRTPGAWDALIHWSNRSYWSRAWVVQEFVLGPSLVVQCGTARVTWTALRLFLRLLGTARPLDQSNHSITMFLNSPAYALMQQKAEYTAEPLPLIKLLVRNQLTICKDPVDKVYSLLGLATDSDNEPQIQVSYSKNALQLAHEVLAHCNIQPRNIARYVRFLSRILALEPTRPTQRRGAYLPVTANAQLSWSLPGFVTGEIIECDTLSLYRNQDCPGRPEQNQFMQSPAFCRASAGLPPETRSMMLDACAELDVAGLRRKMECLQRVSLRTRPAPTGQRIESSSYETLPSFLITVYTVGCVEKDVLVGVACGQLAQGLQIVQFIGCETGLIVGSILPVTGSPRILGLCTCIKGKMKLGRRLADMETMQELRYHSISSEVDGADDLVRVNFDKRLVEIVSIVS